MLLCVQGAGARYGAFAGAAQPFHLQQNGASSSVSTIYSLHVPLITLLAQGGAGSMTSMRGVLHKPLPASAAAASPQVHVLELLHGCWLMHGCPLQKGFDMGVAASALGLGGTASAKKSKSEQKVFALQLCSLSFSPRDCARRIRTLNLLLRSPMWYAGFLR